MSRRRQRKSGSVSKDRKANEAFQAGFAKEPKIEKREEKKAGVVAYHASIICPRCKSQNQKLLRVGTLFSNTNDLEIKIPFEGTYLFTSKYDFDYDEPKRILILEFKCVDCCNSSRNWNYLLGIFDGEQTSMMCLPCSDEHFVLLSADTARKNMVSTFKRTFNQELFATKYKTQIIQTERALTELESLIIDCLLETDKPMTTSEVIRWLAKDESFPYSLNSVASCLLRLVRKKILQRTEEPPHKYELAASDD